MELEELSFKECLLLGRRAERRCARRFRALARRLKPCDAGLAAKLQALAADEEQHEATIEGLDQDTGWPLTWHLDEYWIRQLLEERFPTLFGEEEGEVDPPTARFVVRSIEEESMRFYRALAARAPDERSRALLEEIQERENAHREAF